MCYHEKISPYWSGLRAKAALLTGRQNMSQGQYFIHLACSLHHCERVFFWAVYNNTCALYFPQINGNARGATQDGCHRQVNLSTAEQRHTGQDRGGPAQRSTEASCVLNRPTYCTHLLYLIMPTKLWTISNTSFTFMVFSIHLLHILSFFIIKYIILWLVGEVNREAKKWQWAAWWPLPGDNTGGRREGRVAHTGGPDLDQVSRALGQPAS